MLLGLALQQAPARDQKRKLGVVVWAREEQKGRGQKWLCHLLGVRLVKGHAYLAHVEGDIHGADLINPVNFNLNQVNSIKHNQISRQKKMVGW